MDQSSNPASRERLVKPLRTAWFAPGITAAEQAGAAATAVDGKLVDYAMGQRARRVLALANLERPR
jgi:citrate lyase beta subunit